MAPLPVEAEHCRAEGGARVALLYVGALVKWSASGVDVANQSSLLLISSFIICYQRHNLQSNHNYYNK